MVLKIGLLVTPRLVWPRTSARGPPTAWINNCGDAEVFCDCGQRASECSGELQTLHFITRPSLPVAFILRPVPLPDVCLLLPLPFPLRKARVSLNASTWKSGCPLPFSLVFMACLEKFSPFPSAVLRRLCMRLNLRVGLLQSLRHLRLCNRCSIVNTRELMLQPWFNPFRSDMSISSCPLSGEVSVSVPESSSMSVPCDCQYALLPVASSGVPQ